MAAHFRYPNPDKMLAEMTSVHYTRWLAFYGYEPFGPMQEDYRAGLLAMLICRVAGDKQAKPETFFQSIAGPKPRQSSNQMAGIAKAFSIAHNQSKKRGHPKKP